MSQGNHLNLDLGTARTLYLDRTLLGGISLDTRDEQGNRKLQNMSAMEQGIVKKFLYQGKEQQLLTPKKDELNLWTVVIENSNGESSWRLDMILASQPLKPTEPGKVAQGVRQAIQDADYIPVDQDQ